MLSREDFFKLMNMSREGRRAYYKKHGVKIPGLQDSPYVSTTQRSKDNGEPATDPSAENVHQTEGQVPLHESSADAVHR